MAEKIKSDNEGRQEMILVKTNIDYVCLHGGALTCGKGLICTPSYYYVHMILVNCCRGSILQKTP